VNTFFLNFPNPSSRCGSGGQSASNKNEYQEQNINVQGSKVRRVRRDDNLAAICEPIV
jgi:hypothetical protein